MTHPESATALVPVFTGTLAGQSTPLCNARDLHAVLGVGRDFTTWIRERIEAYGFIDGEDFCSPNSGSKRQGRGGHNRTDYHLTLDMAKELAMVENNDIGRQVRRYFIRIEKEARAAPPAFDLRATMLAGNATPSVPLPPALQTAINRRAWAMAGSAYDLCREHLARRVAYQAELGRGGVTAARIDMPKALATIEETTLDMALAPTHYNALKTILGMMEMAVEGARDVHEKTRAALQQHGLVPAPALPGAAPVVERPALDGTLLEAARDCLPGQRFLLHFVTVPQPSGAPALVPKLDAVPADAHVIAPGEFAKAVSDPALVPKALLLDIMAAAARRLV